MFRRVNTLLLTATVMVASLVVPAAAHAQSGGIKGGLLYSSLDFEDVDDVYDSRTGWTAGVFFGTAKTQPVGVQGEVNILSKRVFDSIAGEDVNLYYVQIPVLLRVGGGETVNVYGLVGPSFDIKVGEEDEGVTLVDDYEGVDVGIVGGIGVEIQRFIVEARGTWGLRNIAKSLNDFDGGKLTSRTVALQVGIRF